MDGYDAWKLATPDDYDLDEPEEGEEEMTEADWAEERQRELEDHYTDEREG